MLNAIDNVKAVPVEENWDWDNNTLCTIDVKALYPSIKFEFIKVALMKCFTDCTTWNRDAINILIDIIIYTLSHQQILWNNAYYILNQGIPTGAKHSVPLANIFLTFILLELFRIDNEFKDIFENKVKLWKRFIDDCGGIISGNVNDFKTFFKKLNNHFNTFSLELTCDTDTHKIDGDIAIMKEHQCVNFLDIHIFKADNTIHTREYRKETSTLTYLKYNSAHPRHAFAGIIKSQLYRLRRLCSREGDFEEAVLGLRNRCLKSDYPEKMISDILNNAPNITRNIIVNTNRENIENIHIARLVILSGTSYEKEFSKFTFKMNTLMAPQIKIELVKATAFPISRLLFHNSVNMGETVTCVSQSCFICSNVMKNSDSMVTSNITSNSYKTDKRLNCNDGGIYVITGGCGQQYTGKTTNTYSNRTNEHFCKSKTSSIFSHKQNCGKCVIAGDCSVTFVENYLNRGKYTLSEREYLWNCRIKGTLNIQKTLRF